MKEPAISATKLTVLFYLLVIALAAYADETGSSRTLMRGATVCDFLAYQVWARKARGWAPLKVLREHGIGWVRVGVTTRSCPLLRKTNDWGALPWRDQYWSCLEYAERILQMSSDQGMRLDVFLFLSDRAAHGGRQTLPAEWVGLSLEDICQRVETSCFEIAAYFRERGLNVEIYEIGNEIERGVLGFPHFPSGKRIDWLRKMGEDTDWLRKNVWRTEVTLLKAAIRGVKRAAPTVKILLHIGAMPPPNDAYVTAFFEAMATEGVRFDYAGLSVYPRGTRWADWRRYLSRWTKALRKLGKPVVISEFSYPNASRSETRDHLLAEYAPTPEGQASFVRDFLAWCKGNPNIVAAFYFYADHVPGLCRDQLPGLFLDGDLPRPAPALGAFEQ